MQVLNYRAVIKVAVSPNCSVSGPTIDSLNPFNPSSENMQVHFCSSSGGNGHDIDVYLILICASLKQWILKNEGDINPVVVVDW